MNFGLLVMHSFCRVLFFLAILLSVATIGFSQLIEKAPASPVAVDTKITDSIHGIITVSDIILPVLREPSLT
jgi:hypothetical protein